MVKRGYGGPIGQMRAEASGGEGFDGDGELERGICLLVLNICFCRSMFVAREEVIKRKDVEIDRARLPSGAGGQRFSCKTFCHRKMYDMVPGHMSVMAYLPCSCPLRLQKGGEVC